MADLRLPDNPSLEHLKNQARDLQRRVAAGDAEALDAVRRHHPRGVDAVPTGPDGLNLAAAQTTVARRYGFASWPRLKAHVEAVATNTRNPHEVPVDDPARPPEDSLLVLGCLAYGGDDLDRQRAGRRLLAAQPDLAGANPFTAAAAGDVTSLRRLLVDDPGAARRAGGPFNWPPALYLTYSRLNGGETEGLGLDPAGALRLLLDAGADPNSGYLWAGMTSPFTALTGVFGEGEDAGNQPRHPDEQTLGRMLLEAGADPNDPQTLYNRHFRPDDSHLHLLLEFGLGTGGDGPWHRLLGPTIQTPAELMADQVVYASAKGYAARVRLLLDRGADPDGEGHPIYGGRHAYELAVVRGHSEIAVMLLEAGASKVDIDPVDRWLGAVLAGDDATAREVEMADPGAADRARAERPHAVLLATEHGDVDAVRRLAALGFDVGHRHRKTALHQAAFDGDIALVEALLDLGADPTVRDDDYNSRPRDWAAHNHQADVVALLDPLTPPG